MRTEGLKPTHYALKEGGQWHEWPQIARIPRRTTLYEFCERAGIVHLKFSAGWTGRAPVFDIILARLTGRWYRFEEALQ